MGWLVCGLAGAGVRWEEGRSGASVCVVAVLGREPSGDESLPRSSLLVSRVLPVNAVVVSCLCASCSTPSHPRSTLARGSSRVSEGKVDNVCVGNTNTCSEMKVKLFLVSWLKISSGKSLLFLRTNDLFHVYVQVFDLKTQRTNKRSSVGVGYKSFVVCLSLYWYWEQPKKKKINEENTVNVYRRHSLRDGAPSTWRTTSDTTITSVTYR